MRAPLTIPCALYSKRSGDGDYAWFRSEGCPETYVCDDLRARFQEGAWSPPPGQDRVRAIFLAGVVGQTWVVLVSQEREVLPAGGGRSFHRTRMALLSQDVLAEISGLERVIEALEAASLADPAGLRPLRIERSRAEAVSDPAAREALLTAMRTGTVWMPSPTAREAALGVLADIYRQSTAWDPKTAPSLLEGACNARHSAYRIQIVSPTAGRALALSSPSTVGVQGVRGMDQGNGSEIPGALSGGAPYSVGRARPPSSVRRDEPLPVLPLHPWPWRWLVGVFVLLLGVLGWKFWPALQPPSTSLPVSARASEAPRRTVIRERPRLRRAEGGVDGWRDTDESVREGPQAQPRHHEVRRRTISDAGAENCDSAGYCPPLGY